MAVHADKNLYMYGTKDGLLRAMYDVTQSGGSIPDSRNLRSLTVLGILKRVFSSTANARIEIKNLRSGLGGCIISHFSRDVTANLPESAVDDNVRKRGTNHLSNA